MLSENQQIKACYLKKELPMLDEPITVRIKFRKVGDLQYISHLDLQRTLHRILVRAGIPMWYTKGFNPHAKIVFSSPLSVGAQSECEFVDIRIEREISCERIKELLNREVTSELEILEAYIPKTKFSDMMWASYTIEVCREGLDSELIEKINEIMSRQELITTKKTKSGEKEVNISPLIKSSVAVLSDNNEKVVIEAVLNINAENYLNPELLLNVLNKELGLLEAEPDKIYYSIMRNEVYLEDGVTLFR